MDNTLVEEINKLIDKYDGQELWLESVKLAIKTNPTIANEVKLVIKENREIRASLVDKTYATSETKSMRYGYRWPVSIQTVLEVVDPSTFPINQHEIPKQNKIMKKIDQVFAEFRIPEKV